MLLNVTKEMLSNEEWKDIVIEQNGVLYDFTGRYQVSNYGRVRSLQYYRNVGYIHVMGLTVKKTKYVQISLRQDGEITTFSVHRLVANAFIPKVEGKEHINHIDENPLNNHVSNLEWCTPEENVNHGTRNERASKKLKEVAKNRSFNVSKPVICIETGEEFESTNDAARKTGLDQGNISKCCRGKQKTCGKCHWKFKEDYLIEQLMAN